MDNHKQAGTVAPEAETAESNRGAATVHGAWMVWTVIGLAAIWIAVTLISFLAPDLVSGSEQQHLPVAAFTTWVWGLGATGAFSWAMSQLRGRVSLRPIWTGLAAFTLVVWAVATILSIVLPVFETGSDPTRVPIAAIIVPLAAALLTALAGIIAKVFASGLE